MPETLEELGKRAAALEQRAITLEHIKSDKAEVADVVKRTAALENKFGIAIAVASVLGLGGAGIGVLLYRA